MRDQALGAGTVAPTLRSLAPFRLYQPATMDEAVEAIRAEPDLVVAAGCSDLVAGIREGLPIEALMSVRRLPELTRIVHENDTLSVGAAVTHHQAATSSLIGDTIPGLAAAWNQVATVRIRFAGTLGGNLMARRHRYELPILFGALDGRLVFHGGASEDAAWLWDGTSGPEHRLLERVEVPTANLLWFGYDRSMRPTTTVAVAIRRTEGGLDVTAATGSEYRPTYLARTRVDGDLDAITQKDVAAELAEQLPESAADYSGDIDYRRHLVGVLSRRLLEAATHPEKSA